MEKAIKRLDAASRAKALAELAAIARFRGRDGSSGNSLSRLNTASVL